METEQKEQTVVRNYAAMTKELENLKSSFEKGKITENEYLETKKKILQDMYDYKYKKKKSSKSLKSQSKQIVKIILEVIAAVFAILGLVFTILPLESFGLASLGIAVLVAIIVILVFKEKKKKSFSKYLILFSIVVSIVAASKLIFVKNKVVKDKQFEQTIKKSQQEDIKDLEGLK